MRRRVRMCGFPPPVSVTSHCLTLSKSVHFPADFIVSFPTAEPCSILCVDHIFTLHSFVDAQRGWLRFLAVSNGAATNQDVHAREVTSRVHRQPTECAKMSTATPQTGLISQFYKDLQKLNTKRKPANPRMG